MDTTFGEWLTEELRAREMSQSDLARAAGIKGTGSISDVITGRRPCGPRMARAIARGLKIPPEEVFEIAGLLPEKKSGPTDRWILRIEHKLEQIKDEKSRDIIEKTIDILSPDKKIRTGRNAKNEGTS